MYLAVTTTITSDPTRGFKGAGPPLGREGWQFICTKGPCLRCDDKAVGMAGCPAPAHKGGGGSCLTSYRQPRDSISPTGGPSVLSHKSQDKDHVSSSLPDLVNGGRGLPVPGSQGPGLRLRWVPVWSTWKAAFIVYRASLVEATPGAGAGPQ